MMLHEAVMLEIYRQALSASELASPRCQSRESNASASLNNDGRCPSNESHCSANETSTSPNQTPIPTASPTAVGLPLPATLAPAAAAALLPPQSAAMAAYLNAAAAAAQQNHLLLTNPLAAAASFVQQATQQHAKSPNSQRRSSLSPAQDMATTQRQQDMMDSSALDFSKNQCRRNSYMAADGEEEEEDDEEQGNASDEYRNDNEADNTNDNENDDVNSPLDLSVNNNRKRQSDEDEDLLPASIIPNRKLARSNDYKSLPASSTWVPPINPYLAAVAAANLSPKNPLTLDWNSKSTMKMQPNEATKALEKMTEMTRLGSATGTAEGDNNSISLRNSSNIASSIAATANTTSTTTSNGRHSAWQSHWLNKGADSVKDVFKCVWCKESFATLASLTTHMKETQHCGVNVPSNVGNANNNTAASNQTSQSSHHSRHSGTTTTQSANAAAANNSSTSGSKSDLNMLIKETMPLPRKLVRGQDVWLGKGAEQTRQILKCMWCGTSFRSLAEMTSHMQETQHYTNIISQEQIISWKSSDEKGSRDASGNRGGGSVSSGVSVATNNSSNNTPTSTSPNAAAAAAAVNNANPTVTAVLTCKVCDQAFSTLKELSNHMVKNNHYKEHTVRGAASVPIEPVPPTMIRGRGKGQREKRKKSLPVRKLLEMERAHQDFKCSALDQALKPLRDFTATTRLTCEKCGEKVEPAVFVDHLRMCIQREMMSPSMNNNNNNNNNNNLKSPFGQPDASPSPQTPSRSSDGRKTSDGNISPMSTSTRPDMMCPLPPEPEKSSSTGTSVLNALEQLIEKSFDSRPRHSSSAYGGDGSSNSTPLGSSILRRLGIDDTMDYTKPLMDPQTMQFLRSYSSYPSTRDRSASESSSISERCNSRLEAYTPERSNNERSRQATPRLTPDRHSFKEQTPESFRIKSEPIEDHHQQAEPDDIPINEIPKKISVKKEFSMTDEQEADAVRRNSLTPSSMSEERSITPKSNSSVGKGNLTAGPEGSTSLNALSSMFNNLNNMATVNLSGNIVENNNNNNNVASNPVKKSNGNPLLALQKLCDTTDTTPTGNTRSSSGHGASNLANYSAANSTSAASSNGGSCGGGGSGSSGMLAFSWACNDAVVTADSIIKCSFCDTPFSSKGAYRHHLSKVHFVKDENDGNGAVGGGNSGGQLKSPAALTAASPKSMTSPKSVASTKSPAAQRLEASPPSAHHLSTPTINPYDESPQSKFLKYTELAKQLSSKNA